MHSVTLQESLSCPTPSHPLEDSPGSSAPGQGHLRPSSPQRSPPRLQMLIPTPLAQQCVDDWCNTARYTLTLARSSSNIPPPFHLRSANPTSSQATLGPRVTFPRQCASSGHKATVLSGGRRLTYGAVPQDGHLPVAHQRHDRTPPRGARKSAGRGNPKISRDAGRGEPWEET